MSLLVRWSRRSRAQAPSRGADAGGWALVALVAAFACRVYRDEPPPLGAEATESAQREEQPAPPIRAPEERAPTAPPAAASEALNLWVLNRSKGDLLPQPVEPPGGVAPEVPGARPRAMALAVLGFGPAEPCAEPLVQRALEAIVSGAEPRRAAAALLTAVRRLRWPESEGSFSAILRGSDGRFGAVRSVPAAALSPGLLVASVERGARVDGENPPRSVREHTGELGLELLVPPCAATSAATLGGAPGVLIRGASGEFWGGLVSPELPADAGVHAIIAEYGVSVAVGPAGGVLMITDCHSPPAESIAERVYASSDWILAVGSPGVSTRCRVAHALLTRERAWVSSERPLSWAALEREVSSQPAASAPPAPAPPKPRALRDAGAAPVSAPER